MEVGDKVKVIKNIPSINGMLHEGTIVKIEHMTTKSINNMRVTDDLGKIWYLNEDDVVNVLDIILLVNIILSL